MWCSACRPVYRARRDELGVSAQRGASERRVEEGEVDIDHDAETYEPCPVPDGDIDAMVTEQARQSVS
jgi:hypothetical protein